MSERSRDEHSPTWVAVFVLYAAAGSFIVLALLVKGVIALAGLIASLV